MLAEWGIIENFFTCSWQVLHPFVDVSADVALVTSTVACRKC